MQVSSNSYNNHPLLFTPSRTHTRVRLLRLKTRNWWLLKNTLLESSAFYKFEEKINQNLPENNDSIFATFPIRQLAPCNLLEIDQAYIFLFFCHISSVLLN